jgi:alpha-tubulin suppressor-like RCC1 family protein
MPRIEARRIPLLITPALTAIALGCGDEAQPPSAPGEFTAPATDVPAASTLAFSALTAGTGDNQTCGLTTNGRLYCWGFNSRGSVGDGTTTPRLRPVPVGGALRFRQVNAGYGHVCAVTTDNRAFCWGLNSFFFNVGGQLGDGTLTSRLSPVAVLGGHAFRQVSTGFHHTCGVTTDDRAWCWGANVHGQLGDGTTTQRLRPAAVAGGLRFRHVAAGTGHTCGLATEGRVYCWGSNTNGQLGDGSRVEQRLTPGPVAGERRYRQVDAGDGHTCGVTMSDRAFCWGFNNNGQIGDGRTNLKRFLPSAVAGGLSFSTIAAGWFTTCGTTTADRAFCWGENQAGGLGDGTLTDRYAPVPVAGGHRFTQVTSGLMHSCARTADGIGYCWGDNFGGALGDGTQTDRLRPRAVVGP